MNKTITIYELLGLVKDGKQPKHIKYRGEEWWWGYDTYTYFSCLKQTPDTQINMFTKYVINYCLDDEVEIIEDNDKLEKINVKTGNNCKRFIEYDDETGHHKYTIRLLDEYFSKNINKIIDHINKIEEEMRK